MFFFVHCLFFYKQNLQKTHWLDPVCLSDPKSQHGKIVFGRVGHCKTKKLKNTFTDSGFLFFNTDKEHSLGTAKDRRQERVTNTGCPLYSCM